MPDSPDNHLPVVPCPTCERDVRVSLPRSGEVVSVRAERDHGSATEAERHRLIHDVCPRDHDVFVLYEW